MSEIINMTAWDVFARMAAQRQAALDQARKWARKAKPRKQGGRR
jgi:hypothetical protein